jgi:hypothetical protein
MAESMFGDYGSIFDAATADNVAVRDRALDVAQLQPGRASVYGAHQAGGMLMQNLANMAGMKTARQEKAELITGIMKESQGLDPNDPKSSLILSRKFASANLPNIAQQFAQKYRDMSVKDIELGHKGEELDLQKARDAVTKEHYEDLGEHYEASAAQDTAELAFRKKEEETRISDLAAKLSVDKAALERLINMGELIEIGVEGSTTGAMTWATKICDEKGLNCKITPMMMPGYEAPKTKVKVVTDGSVSDEQEITIPKGSTTSEIEAIAVGVDEESPTVTAPDLNTVEGLNASGLMISNWGALPTGSAEGRAYHVVRNDLIAEHGESEGGELFLERYNADKAKIEAAGVTAQVGVTLFNDVRESRVANGANLDKVTTAISNFSQAKAGSGAAEKLAEGLVQQIFGSKRLAVKEITRIAKAGSFPENLWDGVNSFFTGVKTAQHHDAFLKVLRIYEQEQVAAYNTKSDTMKEFADVLGYNLSDTLFEKRTIPTGFTLRFNPETNQIEKVPL